MDEATWQEMGNPTQRDDSTPKWMMQWPSIGSVGFVGLVDKDKSGGKEVNWIDKKDGLKKNGWRRINVQIDPGVLDTVTPKDTAHGTKLHMGPSIKKIAAAAAAAPTAAAATPAAAATAAAAQAASCMV